jgi:hypothetical protein
MKYTVLGRRNIYELAILDEENCGSRLCAEMFFMSISVYIYIYREYVKIATD